jgi:hypothetical protein
MELRRNRVPKKDAATIAAAPTAASSLRVTVFLGDEFFKYFLSRQFRAWVRPGVSSS